MKQLNNLLILITISLVGLISCSKDVPIIQPVSSDITVNFGKEFASKSIDGISIEMKGISNSNSYTATTNTNGEATFPSVNPGVYNISATIQFTKEQYTSFFGISSTENVVNFSGTLENVNINTVDNSFALELKTSRIGNLLFKQIYYASSDFLNAAGTRDFFFEVYNNSNEVIYADGLYFAQAYGKTNTTISTTTLANGQYDWSKSIGQSKGSASNTDFFYADHVYKIAGSGNEYPVNPGESIVVATSALNHKAPLTTDFTTYQVPNPELTVDLSNADFEVNLVDYLNSIGGFTLDTDIDNPSVPNLEVAHRVNAKDLILDPLGRDSYIIFKTEDFLSYDALPDPRATTVTATTRKYVQIPNSVVIDAVETTSEDPARTAPRRLDTSLDGGAIFVPKGSYSSQAIIRKITQEFGERKVLQDTNNSLNDFDVIDTPVPGGWN